MSLQIKCKKLYLSESPNKSLSEYEKTDDCNKNLYKSLTDKNVLHFCRNPSKNKKQKAKNGIVYDMGICRATNDKGEKGTCSNGDKIIKKIDGLTNNPALQTLAKNVAKNVVKEYESKKHNSSKHKTSKPVTAKEH